MRSVTRETLSFRLLSRFALISLTNIMLGGLIIVLDRFLGAWSIFALMGSLSFVSAWFQERKRVLGDRLLRRQPGLAQLVNEIEEAGGDDRVP